MQNNWKVQIKKLWEEDMMSETSILLRKLKADGISQKEVQEYLEDLSLNVKEDVKDRIFEVLDIVTGYCQEEYRVW